MSRDTFARYPAIETLAREGGGTESRAIRNLGAEQRAQAAARRAARRRMEAEQRAAVASAMERDRRIVPESVLDDSLAAELGITPDELRYQATHGGVDVTGNLPAQRELGSRLASEARSRDINNPETSGLPYDDAALYAGVMPFEDELEAVNDVMTRSDLSADDWRERQQQREAEYSGAQSRSPFSAGAGYIGQALIASRVPLAAVPEGLSGLAALGSAARSALPLAAGGAAIGGTLGAAEADEGERLEGAARGLVQGGATGLLAGIPLAYGARLAARAPVTLAGALRTTAAQGAAEGLGQGMLMGGEASGASPADPEFLSDVAASGASSAAGGALLAPVLSAVPRYLAGTRAARNAARSAPADVTRPAPIEPDAAVSDLGDLATATDDELDAALAETLSPMPRSYPGEPTTAREAMVRSLAPANADALRLQAAGAVDRRQVRELALAFGGGRDGLRRAVDALSDVNVTTPGEVVPTSEIVRRAERARQAATSRLSRGYRLASERGATASGDEIAAALEAEADRLNTPSATPEVRARIADMRARAADLRYGNEGSTPERIMRDRIAAAEARLGETRTGVPLAPGVADEAIPEIDATLIPEAPARTIPFDELRQTIRDVRTQGKLFQRDAATSGARAQNQAAEYRALTGGQSRALGQVMTPDELAAMQQANRGYRATAPIVPDDAVASHDFQGLTRLRSAMARNMPAAGGDVAAAVNAIRGYLERAFTDLEPSTVAAIAETGMPTARESMQAAASAVMRAGAFSGLEPAAVRALSRAASGQALSTAEREAADVALTTLRELRPNDPALMRQLHMYGNVKEWPAIMRSVAELLARENQTGVRSQFGTEIQNALSRGLTPAAAIFGGGGVLGVAAASAARNAPEVPDILEERLQLHDPSIMGGPGESATAGELDDGTILGDDVPLFDPDIHGGR